MPPGSVIGVDVGGTKLLAGAVADDLSVIHRTRRVAAGAADAAAVLDLVAEAIEDARAGAGGDVRAVGVGLPCTFDARTGRAVQAVHLPLEDVPVAALLRERVGLPVAVDNDATLAGLAEWRAGAARGARDALVLTIGTGIGGAVVTDGRLLRGASGAAGEPGHMPVQLDGLPCDCGARGCLETLVSGPALARAAEAEAAADPDGALAALARGGAELDGRAVTALARAGDPGALAIVARMGAVLGAALAGLVNLLDPEVVVVGGGVAAATGPSLLEPAERALRARALPPARDRVRLAAAVLGDEAGMIGAALLARELAATAEHAAA